MARKCPDCGHMNNDELVFCEECGEPIDPKTRLMMELEGTKAPSSGGNPSHQSRRDDDDDDDYIPIRQVEEKKSPIGLILGLAVAAAVVWFLFFR